MYLSTTKCIVCLEKATGHTGHLHLPNEHKTTIFAGFCERHVSESVKINTPTTYCKSLKAGCFGYYKIEFGVQVDEW
jgi:hypothetical protein